jgi:hypothetical protein
VQGKGWTAAGALEAGDILVGHDGRQTAAEADPTSKSGWDTLDKQIFEAVRPLVAQQVAPLRAERGFPMQAEIVLGHQIRHALLEEEFLAQVEPGFFKHIALWILRGRYPCGMGEDGRLFIYESSNNR